MDHYRDDYGDDSGDESLRPSKQLDGWVCMRLHTHALQHACSLKHRQSALRFTFGNIHGPSMTIVEREPVSLCYRQAARQLRICDANVSSCGQHLADSLSGQIGTNLLIFLCVK